MTRNIFLMLCAVWMTVNTADARITLEKKGTRAEIVVDGKPMLILGGELSNSAATSVADIDSVLPRMARMGLNTVLVPAQWDLLEPTEGTFDYTLIDETIAKARENDLKIIFLWFGAWKNSMSCYAPLWFKRDTKRFPRALTKSGKPLEIASAFSEEVFQADNRAFTALIRRIKAKDPAGNIVIMVQVENEIGMLEEARDHSPLAEKAYKGWTEKKDGTLEDDERFMACHYAKYVERLAKNAHSIADIPLYVNAAMNSRGRRPGEYPSAGPLAHLMDIWKKEAPSIALMAPDIYDTGFKQWAAQYDTKENPLFIPESRCCINSGVRALYVFGAHEAVGFSPFAIDQASREECDAVTKSYAMLSKISPILLKARGKGGVFGVLFSQDDKETVINDGDCILTCRHNFTLPWDPRATDGSTWPEGGAVIVRLNPLEYLIAGNGIVVSFQTAEENRQSQQKELGEDGFATAGKDKDASQTKKEKKFHGKRLGIGFLDEVDVDADGRLVYLRRENGDQDHQGRHARISVGEHKILHVQLYSY